MKRQLVGQLTALGTMGAAELGEKWERAYRAPAPRLSADLQAAVRALAIAAMKGSRLSQKALAEMVREVEDRRAKEHAAALDVALEYKLKWKAEIERCERLGLEPPRPLPDPDDIIIDFRTGELRTEGPLDEREKQGYDERIARREEAQSEVNYFVDRYRRARSEELKAGGWRNGISSNESSTSSTTACRSAIR